jgi:hypothetical protein
VGRYLLRKRVFEALRQNSFSGWRSYPVQVFGKDKDEIDGYEGLQITGRSQEQDKSRGIEVPGVGVD